MPLSAVLDGRPVCSIFATEDEWERLRSATKTGALRMECGVRAIARTSSLGLRHFAHRSQDDCNRSECWSESAQHQAAKAIVALAARESGWNVDVESAAPDRSWIADILADKAGRRVALEIQWSAQSAADFIRRQERYTRDGIECIWFVHRRNRLTAELSKVPHQVFDGDTLPLDVFELGDSAADRKTVPLHDATANWLTGRYRLRIELSPRDVTFALTSMDCFICHEASTVWRLDQYHARTRCGMDVTFSHDYEEYAAERIESLLSDVAALAMGQHRAPMAQLGMYWSNKAGKRYLAYGCAHCINGFMGDYWVSGSTVFWGRTRVPFAGVLPVRPDLLEHPHICNALGEGQCSQQRMEVGGPAVGSELHTRYSAAEGPGMDTQESAKTIAPALAPRTSEGVLNKYRDACDLCETSDHPEFECLSRRIRRLANWEEVAANPGWNGGEPHFSDLYVREIRSGKRPEGIGTEQLRTTLNRLIHNLERWG